MFVLFIKGDISSFFKTKYPEVLSLLRICVLFRALTRSQIRNTHVQVDNVGIGAFAIRVAGSIPTPG